MLGFLLFAEASLAVPSPAGAPCRWVGGADLSSGSRGVGAPSVGSKRPWAVEAAAAARDMLYTQP